MASRAFALAGAIGFAWLGCQVAPPPQEEPSISSTVENASSQAVDRHGNWKRWANTPALRDEALARIQHLPSFGFGREATPEEIAAIDIDVMPDGSGLPDGSGSVARGKALYQNQCVQCHGEGGRGAEQEALVVPDAPKEFPFGSSVKRPITVGNYWPYAPTLYDYIYRAMPHAVPGSLPPDDVYSLVAYILYLNELVAEDATLDRHSLPQIEMPARDRFVYDDRTGGGIER